MPNIKAVIVDDDDILRHLLKTLLKQNNIKVVGEATNGVDALKQCDRYLPDILILDINMPLMGGFEALKRIRSAHPDILVFMISSDSTTNNVEEASKIGINGFIVKPFTASKVLDIINNSLKLVGKSIY